VAYNLFFLGILSFVVCILTLLKLPELNTIRLKVLDGNHTLQVIVILGIILLFVGLLVFVFWIFYKILYGILLKKLNVNYQELKKIDL
jgi:dolichyl-phosphate-mannose--protein O-mannosyl transferase